MAIFFEQILSQPALLLLKSHFIEAFHIHSTVPQPCSDVRVESIIAVLGENQCQKRQPQQPPKDHWREE